MARHSLFDSLGRMIDAATHATDLDELRFSAVATDIVRQARIPHHFRLSTLAREILSAQTSIETSEGQFGQPPVTVYRGRRFTIELLFWLEGTTDVHQHNFSGAFQVIQGASIHTTYAWQPTRRINSRLHVGDAKAQSTELLRQGDVRAIVSGGQFIHALFHLDHPSISMVVRTHTELDQSPQFSYFLPHFRYDDFARDYHLRLKLRWLQMVRASQPGLALRQLTVFLGSATREDLFLAAREFMYDELFVTTICRHASRIDRDFGRRLSTACKATAHQHALIGLRRTATGTEGRFLLALLLNVRGRRPAARLLEQRFPGESPSAALIRILRPLTSGERPDSGGLGLRLDEGGLMVVRCLFEGLRGDALVKRLRTKFDVDAASLRQLRSLERDVLRTSVLQSLLVDE